MIASPEKIGILLLDDYPIIPFSCVVDSLRKANPLAEKHLFGWEFFAPDDNPVTSSCGITVLSRPLSEADGLAIRY